jgi:hypothetical protein
MNTARVGARPSTAHAKSDAAGVAGLAAVASPDVASMYDAS